MSTDQTSSASHGGITSVLVTGGAGFIGANLLNWAVKKFPSINFKCLDSLDYSGHLDNLAEIIQLPNFTFQKVDICNVSAIQEVVESDRFDWVFHLAAQTHVDRSLQEPLKTVQTNVVGTSVLLDAFRIAWRGEPNHRFIHVSTDEVFGSVREGRFDEMSRYDPSSPYSATKAASDHLARAYFRSYDFPVIVTNCCNNYGAFQFPEKLIPLTILRLLSNMEVPIYGDGLQVREWIFVEDHVRGLWQTALCGQPGKTYLFGSNEESTNLGIVDTLCGLIAQFTGRAEEELKGLITHVEDRPGHDLRYAIDSSETRVALGWDANTQLKDGLRFVCEWYLEHHAWIKKVGGEKFDNWLQLQYSSRLRTPEV